GGGVRCPGERHRGEDCRNWHQFHPHRELSVASCCRSCADTSPEDPLQMLERWSCHERSPDSFSRSPRSWCSSGSIWGSTSPTVTTPVSTWCTASSSPSTSCSASFSA